MAYSLENTTELTALANAIRAKTGGSGTMTVSQMTSAVGTISSGGGGSGTISSEILNNTGNIPNKFVNNNWNKFLEDYGSQLNFSNITNLNSCFENSTGLTNELGGLAISTSTTSPVSMKQALCGCENITDIPTFIGRADNIHFMFYECKNLRNILSSKVNSMDFTQAHSSYANYNQPNYLGYGIFSKCYSLRQAPSHILMNCWSLADSNLTAGANYYNYSVFVSMFRYCFVLDEITNLTIPDVEYTQNQFLSTFQMNHRLKDLKFRNTGIRRWKGQYINLSDFIGYAPASGFNRYCYEYIYSPGYDEGYVNQNDPCPHPITGWNSGITNATKITDATSYEALKDNADSWTDDVAYSRYNKISAYETIKTLPDTSAYLTENGGTNTITFRGNAGSATDGGAINTLSSAEIATATAKGWTVSFV